MNFPNQEAIEAFLSELEALEDKYGFGFSIGGYEYEIDFRPGDGCVAQFRDAVERSTSAGWDDVLHYGPPTPFECLSPFEQMMQAIWRQELQHSLWEESQTPGETTELGGIAKIVGTIRVTGDLLND